MSDKEMLVRSIAWWLLDIALLFATATLNGWVAFGIIVAYILIAGRMFNVWPLPLRYFYGKQS